MPPEGRIGFRPVGHDDLPLIAAWLARPHVKEWWGDPDEEVGFIRDMVEERDTSRPFLILLEGVPVGYIQYWFIGHHQNETWLADNPWLADLPADAVGVDLTIGIAELVGQGLGSRALAAFCESLSRDGHRTITIDPDRTNARAIRAYEKAGFRTIPELTGRTKDILLMRYAPNTNEMHI